MNKLSMEEMPAVEYGYIGRNRRAKFENLDHATLTMGKINREKAQRNYNAEKLNIEKIANALTGQIKYSQGLPTPIKFEKNGSSSARISLPSLK